jgi:O-antigen/teichoic acid export membrane protein
MRRLARHPVTLLLAANVASAGLGLVSLTWTLMILDVADFAVIGVMLGFGTLVSMGVDLRLADLVARRFFEQRSITPACGLAVARAGFLIFLMQGAVVVGIAVSGLALTAPLFLAKPVAAWWMWSAALFCGVQLTMAGLMGLVRFCGAFVWAAAIRVLFQLASTIALLMLLSLDGSLDGYFRALLVSAATGLLVAGVVAGRVVRETLDGGLLGLPPKGEVAAIVTGLRAIGSGGLFSAGWMLTRAGDVLVVAAFSNEIVTGTYRVARQVVDAVSGILDAVPHYFEPSIIAALKSSDWESFRHHRRRVIASGAVVGLLTIVGLYPALSLAVASAFPRYEATVVPILVQMLAASLRLAVQPWLWASCVALGGMGRFSALLLAGSLAQLGVIASLAALGLLTATTAAAAVWVALAVLFLPYLVGLRRGPGVEGLAQDAKPAKH